MRQASDLRRSSLVPSTEKFILYVTVCAYKSCALVKWWIPTKHWVFPFQDNRAHPRHWIASAAVLGATRQYSRREQSLKIRGYSMDFPKVFPHQVMTMKFFSAPKVLKNQMPHRGSKVPWLSPVHATENICLLCLCDVLRFRFNLVCIGDWKLLQLWLRFFVQLKPCEFTPYTWLQLLVHPFQRHIQKRHNWSTNSWAEVRTQPRCWCSVHWCPKS